MSSAKIEDLRKTLEKLKRQIEHNKYQALDTSLDQVAKNKNVPAAERISASPKQLLRGHFAKVYAMQWCPSANHVVSASQDGKLIVWNAVTGNKIHAIPLRSSWVMTCAYSKSGTLVACGGLDNICSVYNLKQKEAPIRVTRELSVHTGYLSCCRFMNDRSIITASGDMTCAQWDVETGSIVHHFQQGHTGDVMSVSVPKDGEGHTFISGACDMKAMLWDCRTGSSVATFAGHKGDINAIQYFPNGQLFATGSDDSQIRLFDIRSFHCLNVYSSTKLSQTGITSVEFSHSGKYLFGGYDDFKVHAWDTIRHKENDASSGELHGHSNRVSCLGLSYQGHALCTGSWDNFLKVWAP